MVQVSSRVIYDIEMIALFIVVAPCIVIGIGVAIAWWINEDIHL